MAELTQQEIIDAITKQIAQAKTSNRPSIGLNPDATTADIKKDAAKIKSKAELSKYLKTGVLPTHGFTETALAQIGGTPYGAAANAPLAGIAFTGGAGVKAIGKLAGAIKAKKAADVAEEGVKVAGKGGKILTKKNAAKLGVLGAAGAWATNALGNIGGGNDANAANDPQAIAQQNALEAIQNANLAGVDVTTVAQGLYGKQLGLNADNILAFANKGGIDTSAGLVGLNGVGIFTGKETKGTKVGPKGVVYPTSKREVVSLADWKKMFPTDMAQVNDLKSKFGLDPSAGIFDVKNAWDKYGELSLNYARAGQTISPYDLAKINRGLTGGGGGSKTQVTIDESPMAENDIKQIAKNQLAKSLGLANIDDSMWNDILKVVRKKEAKNPTKRVVTTTGNKSVVKTTPGYGQSDIMADVEAYAKTDPRYGDFQTADVFGNALVKALGLKS
jgi:hypothetical protein